MAEYRLTASDVLEEADAVKAAVSEALASEPGDQRLKLTGLEILAFAGLKLALPIFCGLVSRALYDKYKDLQTTRKAELAMEELLKHAGSPDPVSDDELINHTIERLLDEGVPKAKAGQIANQTLKQVKQRLAAA